MYVYWWQDEMISVVIAAAVLPFPRLFCRTPYAHAFSSSSLPAPRHLFRARARTFSTRAPHAHAPFPTRTRAKPRAFWCIDRM